MSEDKHGNYVNTKKQPVTELYQPIEATNGLITSEVAIVNKTFVKKYRVFKKDLKVSYIMRIVANCEPWNGFTNRFSNCPAVALEVQGWLNGFNQVPYRP